MNQARKTVVEQLDELLRAAGHRKSAEAAADQGHVENQGDSGTTHPSKNAPDFTQPVSTGAHYSENTADVKKQTPNVSVDAASEDKMDGASVNELTTASAIGEDPSVETESIKNVNYVGSQNADGSSIKDAAVRLMNDYNVFNAMVAGLTLTPVKQAESADDKPSNSDSGARAESAPDAKSTSCASETSGGASAAAHAGGGDKANEKADEEAGEKAAAVVAQAMAKTAEECETIVAEVIKEAMTDAAMYVDFIRGRAAAKTARVVKPAAKPIKRAMDDNDVGAEITASGGEGDGGSESDGAGAGAGDPSAVGGLEAALMALGLTPEDLESIPPEVLAEAIANALGAGGDPNTMPVEAMPPDAAPVDPAMAAA